MSKRRPIPPSESQINAQALVRRNAPYSETHADSVAFAWDYRQHIPDDLRGMVRAARRAYEDEVPTKLHEGPDNIGEGGTPKMAAGFVRYIDQPGASDAPPAKCNCDTETPGRHMGGARPGVHYEDCAAASSNRPLVSHYLTPFRAQMDRMTRGGSEREMRAAIVSAITIGGQEPFDAVFTVAEKYPQTFARVFARLVAEDALRVFLRGMSDLKVHVRTEAAA